MKYCRATFITRALRKLLMAEVMKMTGHKVPATVVGHYLAPTADAHNANTSVFEAEMIANQLHVAMASDRIN